MSVEERLEVLKAPKFATRQGGRWVEETWIPCKEFASRIGRPYTTVLAWMRRKWIPAIEMGKVYYTCITPWPRAKRAYLALKKSGLLRKPQPRPKIR